MRYKLVTGSAMLLLLAFTAAFPAVLSDFPRGYRDLLRSVEGPAGIQWLFAPEPPGSLYPWGTDKYGYDIATLLLWGLRWTLGCVFLVALLRTLVGGAIGIVRSLFFDAGNFGLAVSPLSVVPSFLFVFFITFPVTINPSLGSFRLFIFQCAVMTMFDMGGIISSISLKTAALRKTPFVEAAVSCGAGKLRIARLHILPFLAEDLLETFSVQTVSVLQLVGRLGVFSLFVGGTIMTIEPMILTSATGEIAGLVGLYRGNLQGARWILLYPLAFYLFILTAFRLFVSGLHEKLLELNAVYT